MTILPARIITCPEWGARQPTSPIVNTSGWATRIIFHHTAGHHPELAHPADESREEAIRYARAIQNFHMDVNGWIDCGHNFLVCRNGMVLQGRWHTVREILKGRMVVSAHCPGQNSQVGIEHEHVPGEAMTAAQFEASAYLQAWVAARYARRRVLPVDPHSKHWATACPGNLKKVIPGVRARAQQILDAALGE